MGEAKREAKRIADGLSNAIEASGPSVQLLANEVSLAICSALERGLPAGLAACVVITAAADYARAEYGDGYMLALSRVVIGRVGKPLPERRPSAEAGS
jgi:hypothetical protein